MQKLLADEIAGMVNLTALKKQPKRRTIVFLMPGIVTFEIRTRTK
jgi:hypothetical protein